MVCRRSRLPTLINLICVVQFATKMHRAYGDTTNRPRPRWCARARGRPGAESRTHTIRAQFPSASGASDEFFIARRRRDRSRSFRTIIVRTTPRASGRRLHSVNGTHCWISLRSLASALTLTKGVAATDGTTSPLPPAACYLSSLVEPD